MKNLRKHGFSLIELIVVIAVIAAISAIIIPTMSGTNEVAKDQKAIAAAEALNMAQVQYRLQNGAAWTVAGDEARYDAIKGYMTYAQASLADFQTNIDANQIYKYQFPDFDNGHAVKVTITKNGAPFSY
jgi:prepilin-type N-terminal cleavage/methylation domain-containing protein